MLQRRRRTLFGLGALVATATIWVASGDDGEQPPRAPSGPAEFIEFAAPSAQQSMATFDVPASVSLAQAILESNWAQSELTVTAANYFGIKCAGGSPYTSGCVDRTTQECDHDGECFQVVASFRAYASAEDSFRDHGHFLTTNSRYQPAFAHVDDPDRFAQEIALAGYATDPSYADKLIALMQQYDLYRFDTA